jgi:HAD superfamily hydrolase (TIGR01509 family)
MIRPPIIPLKETWVDFTSKANNSNMDEFIVIFDMDGVIVDSEQVYQDIERQMYDNLGIPVTPEEHRLFIGAAERTMWQYMKDKYQMDAETDLLVKEERTRFMYMVDQPGSILLMPGLIELLEALDLDGISAMVASSSSREIIEKVLRVNDIRHFFKDITGGDDVIHSKPAPDIFLETAAKAGMSPDRCLVIEDSENGIRAARSAGMKVIALFGRHSSELDLSEASKIIHNFDEIDTPLIRELLR